MDTTQSLSPSLQLIIGIAGMLTLAISIIVFFLIYQRRLFKEQERANQIESDYQKELLNASIRAQEEERKRMARDLHDSVGSLLSTTKIYLTQLSPEQDQEDFQRFRNKAVEVVNENIGNVRSISHALLPPTLERMGLIAAIDSACKKINGTDQIEVEFNWNDNIRFNVQYETALFRIVQELINNTIKYAEATNILIQLVFGDQHLELTYKDNGKGFDFEKERNENTIEGLGLKSIESRVGFIGGKLNYFSAPKQGVEVVVELELVSKN